MDDEFIHLTLILRMADTLHQQKIFDRLLGSNMN